MRPRLTDWGQTDKIGNLERSVLEYLMILTVSKAKEQGNRLDYTIFYYNSIYSHDQLPGRAEYSISITNILRL